MVPLSINLHLRVNTIRNWMPIRLYQEIHFLYRRYRYFKSFGISLMNIWCRIYQLSSLCKLIWRQWTYNMPVRYILFGVWVRLSMFSQLSIMQYMGLCISVYPSFMMMERIYALSYYHHQIGRMNYYPLFRVRSWNNGMRSMSLYILSERLQ